MNIQKLIESSRVLQDPRRQKGYLQHKLIAIVVITFCAIICGAEDYEDIEEFGNLTIASTHNVLELGKSPGTGRRKGRWQSKRQ